MTSATSPVTVRAADPADGAALLQLTLATPMQADISLQIERDPDFFALSRARGEPYVVVAERDGRMVGCASTVRRPARLSLGEIGEIGVIADLKVHPEHRRQGVAKAMLDALAAHEATRAPAVFIGATAAGNDAVDGVALQFGASRGLTTVGDITSYQLLPVLSRRRPPAGVVLRSATRADLPALAELLDRFHRRYVLAPAFADGAFEALVERSPDLEIEDYRLAERNGDLIAACAAWDPESMKRTRVLGMPWTLRAVAGLTRLLPMPGLPLPGALLRFRYLRHPCHVDGEEAALRALVREALADTRRAGDHFLLFTCADGDPLASIIAGWPKTSYRYRISAGINRESAAPALASLANVLCYDDAALA